MGKTENLFSIGISNSWNFKNNIRLFVPWYLYAKIFISPRIYIYKWFVKKFGQKYSNRDNKYFKVSFPPVDTSISINEIEFFEEN